MLLLLASTTGCLFSSAKRQVGLVPPPRPTLYDGQKMEKSMRVEGRATTVVGERAPIAGPDAGDHSAFVARDVLGGSVFGMKGETELGVSYDHVRSRNSAPMTVDVQSDRAPLQNGYTVAFSVRRSMPLDDGWAVGLAGDLGWTRVPIVNDDGNSVAANAPLFRGAIVPSYKTGSLTVFASLQLTNDIVVPNMITADQDSDAEASAGGAALIPALGASVHVGGGVKLTTQIAKPFNTAVDHGPQLELSLGYEFGDPVAKR